jgi:ABC-2 type transport system permease protein
MINIIIRKFKDQWRSILYYLAGLTAYSWIMIGMYPSMKNVNFEAYFEQMPKEFLQFFGATDMKAYSTIEGFLSMEYLSSFFILIIAFYVAASAGSTIAGAIEKRTIDFDLSQPISRTRLLLSEAVVSLFDTFLITFGAVYGIWLLCKAYDISISGKGIFAFALTATLLMWAIYGVAILISSLLRSKMSVAAITLAFVLGSFIFYSLTQIFDKLKNYDILSIFYLYPNPQEVLKDGQVHWDKIGILTLILIIGLISSTVIFNKKDI